MAGKSKAGQGGTQTGLPGLDWQTCACGCGTQFLLKGKGRHRKYFNDSHKTRAYRERKSIKAYNDQESQKAWEGWDSDKILDYIMECPDADLAWLGQWELYRRDQLHQTTPAL